MRQNLHIHDCEVGKSAGYNFIKESEGAQLTANNILDIYHFNMFFLAASSHSCAVILSHFEDLAGFNIAEVINGTAHCH